MLEFLASAGAALGKVGMKALETAGKGAFAAGKGLMQVGKIGANGAANAAKFGWENLAKTGSAVKDVAAKPWFSAVDSLSKASLKFNHPFGSTHLDTKSGELTSKAPESFGEGFSNLAKKFGFKTPDYKSEFDAWKKDQDQDSEDFKTLAEKMSKNIDAYESKRQKLIGGFSEDVMSLIQNGSQKPQFQWQHIDIPVNPSPQSFDNNNESWWR